MQRYQTEVLIPADRFVGLQLPMHLPEGRAIVTISVVEADPPLRAEPDDDPDRLDIEWWDEFGDGVEADELRPPAPGSTVAVQPLE